VWVALLKRYNGVGVQDAARVMTQLHHYQLDDSKPFEPQLIEMRGLHDRLASLGDTYTDTKFAVIVSEALPQSYDTLKTIILADLDDASTIACDKLIAQILREEKRKSRPKSSAVLIAKPGKTTGKDPDKSDGKKSKKTKDRPRCTNPNCKWKLGHTFEQCWAEGGGSEGQRPAKSSDKQMAKDKKKDAKVDILLADEHVAVAECDHARMTEWVI
jgi:hypothetical protein